ncbi:FliG C-terminal domain-containing protein [Lignipirellula cremea]|uniref:Flagellar motor switch protein FliG n=1 Tax=Lignipirellula cremea TaxID=2528010 RepID=A0A518DRW7_9BACT|nr:FliG C-terminal domain-containing protein [Lignipirellula cremea]QDU94587.1 Flagellar motor switch protein FliG [Lignipirellula cremea]
MNDNQLALRKAAIFVSTLDSRSADALLDQMGEERASLIRAAVLDLDRIDPDEQQRIVGEFVQARSGRPSDATASAPDELQLSQAAADAPVRPSPVAERAAKLPFHFLREATGGMIANFLQNERPQTVAIVMSHLPARRAAEVLKRLPPELQGDVLRRIAELDQTDPELIQEIEHEIESLLADQIQSHQRRAAGLAAVSAILNEAGQQRESLLRNLSQNENELTLALHDYEQEHRLPSSLPASRLPVSSLRPSADTTAAAPSFAPTPPAGSVPAAASGEASSSTVPHPTTSQAASVPPDTAPTKTSPTFAAMAFTELSELDDKSLAAVLAQADPRITLFALAGADPAFVERIAQRLPRRERKALASRIQHIGPLRLSDIEQAQQYLAHVAGKLIAQGRVRMPRGRTAAAA